VLHHEAGNGHRGWLPENAVRIHREPSRIVVDLSQRRATVLTSGRVVRRFEVAVGRPGHETPTGRFAITDRLLSGQNLPYGCCILALTGRQPNLPAGWPGGDRIAFHGVPDESRIDVGRATSTGCMHVRERDLRWMIRHLRAGARVRIKA
jgi:lipoprotein-anchoring transpeptidase ErfK/SrfK